jgi:hypothetical protein
MLRLGFSHPVKAVKSSYFRFIQPQRTPMELDYNWAYELENGGPSDCNLVCIFFDRCLANVSQSFISRTIRAGSTRSPTGYYLFQQGYDP